MGSEEVVYKPSGSWRISDSQVARTVYTSLSRLQTPHILVSNKIAEMICYSRYVAIGVGIMLGLAHPGWSNSFAAQLRETLTADLQ